MMKTWGRDGFGGVDKWYVVGLSGAGQGRAGQGRVNRVTKT